MLGLFFFGEKLDDTLEIRKEILLRYAKLSSKGRPKVCGPIRSELRGGPKLEPDGTNGKVKFPDQESALAAALELYEFAGANEMRAYACNRGSHYHLSDDLDRSGYHAPRGAGKGE